MPPPPPPPPSARTVVVLFLVALLPYPLLVFLSGNTRDNCLVSSIETDCTLKIADNPPDIDSHDHRDGSTRTLFDPLHILTGEGHETAAGWLSCEASGASNLVASGMDRVGELDPGEVRQSF